jgi:hypothetical protein
MAHASEAAVDSDSILRLHNLHQRILVRDEEAFSELTCKVRPLLRRVLRRQFKLVDTDSVDGGIDDALVDYWGNPNRYDAVRNASLGGYLLLLARRNLSNTLVSNRRRRTREGRYAEENIGSTVCPLPWIGLPLIDNAQTLEGLRYRFLASVALLDRRAARLWLTGERRTSVLATALGLDAGPPDHGRRGVKRFKDRMTKQLQAQIERLGAKRALTTQR